MAAPFYQPVLDAIRAQPDDWLDMVLKLCVAVEAEDRGKIMLLTGPLVAKVNPRMPPIEDLPADVFYEAMARLLFMGADRDFLSLVEWYERLSILSLTRKDQIARNWLGVFERVTLPPPNLSEKELDSQLKRITTALRCVLAAHATAAAEEGPPPTYVPGSGELPPGSFGTATYGRPSLVSVLGDGIRKLVFAWMEVHQQFLDAALQHLGSKAKDRGAKLLSLRTRWLRALELTFGQSRYAKSARLAQLPVELATIRYGRSPHHAYLDAFLPHDARQFGFTPYDREPQDEPPGKSTWLADLLRYRGTQLYFLLDEYGEFYAADGAVPTTAAARQAEAARKKLYADRRVLIDQAEKHADSLNVTSEDDLVSFGCAFHRALLGATAAQASPDDRLTAWESLLTFLQGHLRTQTSHAEFNLDERPSYFDRLFPRAVNGGELLDCGVYAVRLAFVFLSLADCVKAAAGANPPRVSFLVLPLHVGLIVEIHELPPLVVHNNVLIPLKKERVDAWRKEWDATTDVDGPDPTDARLRDRKFLEDVAAQLFIRDVDLPLLRLPITRVSVPPKKHEIWRAFRRAVVPGIAGLFSRRVENPGRNEYQFDTRFLSVLSLEKRWHDSKVVPFWNVECHGLWNKTDANGNRVFTVDALTRNAAKRTSYADALDKLIKPVEDSYDAEVRPKKDELTKEFRAIPGVVGPQAQRITTSSRLRYSASGIGPVGEVREHLEQVRRGMVAEPKFAREAHFLTRIGD